MRFRILTGSFVQDGRYFVKGDVVSSNRDLSKKFQNKFHKLEENEEAPVSKGKNFKSLDGAAPSGEPEPVVKATPKPKKVDMSAVQADLVLVPLGEGKFDVVNPATGVAVNDEFLTAAEALEMVGDDSMSDSEHTDASPTAETAASVDDDGDGDGDADDEPKSKSKPKPKPEPKPKSRRTKGAKSTSKKPGPKAKNGRAKANGSRRTR